MYTYYVVYRTRAVHGCHVRLIHVLYRPPPLFADLQALVDNPSIFEDLGFIAPEGSFMADPCISQDFTVDSTAEIMGTQVSQCRDVAACIKREHQL